MEGNACMQSQFSLRVGHPTFTNQLIAGILVKHIVDTNLLYMAICFCNLFHIVY